MKRPIVAVVFLGASLLPAPGADKPKAAPKQAQPASLVWPMPPAQPRVRWLGEVSDLDEVRGKKKAKANWAQRLAGSKLPDDNKLAIRRPYGIAEDSRGRIYVADAIERAVFVLDMAGHQVQLRRGASRAPLALPVGVAVDAKDRLFVSDAYLHSITCFTPDGAVVTQFGADRLERAAGIALDEKRHRLYVADVKGNRIAVFNPDEFTFERYVGGPSTPGVREPGKFSAPTNLAVDKSGNLYIVDTWNHRVQVLDAAGQFVRQFGTHGDRPGSFVRPKGIAIDSEGHIYVADSEFNNFQVFTPEGRPLLAVGGFGKEPGEFLLLAGIFVSRDDRIFTTEMDGRVQMFQFLSETPKEVTQARK